MPSKITPKDFERFLPEERDTIAQGLVKYIQFAILFWRWYRRAYASDGDMSNAFKIATCGTGCLGGKPVEEGKPDVGDGGSQNEDGTGEPSDNSIEDGWPDEPTQPPVVPPPNNPAPGEFGDCCKPTVPKYEDFFFWENVKNVDLKCSNYKKMVAVRNGTPFGVNFDTGLNANANFNKFVSWAWTSNRGTVHESIPIEGGSGGIDQAGGQISRWDRVIVQIYGFVPPLRRLDQESHLETYPSVQGAVYYNENKSHVDFKLGNNNAFGVEIELKNFAVTAQSTFGEEIRNFRIHISPHHTKPVGSRDVTRDDRFPLEFKSGRIIQEQPYLAFIYGIRLIMLPHGASKDDLTEPWQINSDTNSVHPLAALMDERWQNEIPCYEPTAIPEYKMGKNPEAYAPLWTTEAHNPTGVFEIYTEREFNDMPLTYAKSIQVGQLKPRG